ncbi:MAG: DUF3179 domain-containing protein, partial [Deltaproteobacteria bacterium]|nr:DUF3179 domain-containing protein [Deltaproteobacteria bacterium]
HTFAPGTSPGTVVDTKSGTAWQVKEEHLADPSGNEKLPRLGGHVSFWFGWYAFYPATEVYARE